MIWDDIGFLLSKNRYNENSLISDIYTKNFGKVSGIIFGGTSKKIKNYLQIGNKLYVSYNSKNEKSMGYFKIEIQDALSPLYFDNNQKLSCISSAMNLVRLLTAESQKNIKITEPKITRDHTERMIEFFGGEILYENNQNSKTIQLNYTELEPKNSFDVPGDFSSAAFIIVATIISKGSEVVIKNVGLNESRKGLLDVLILMGANLEIKNKKKASNEIVGDIYISS